MHRRGFTFLEILFMVVIMSVGLIAIMNWVPVSIQTKIKLEQRAKAILLAQGKMEDTKRRVLYNFTNLSENWSIDSINGTVIVSDGTNPDLKILEVNAWHIQRPQDITTFHSKIARR